MRRNQLYQSIPQDLKEIIQAGNQDFNEGEFFATILEGGDFGLLAVPEFPE